MKLDIGCVDVWMYGCVDVWMCGCVDVWMCGCVDKEIRFKMVTKFCVLIFLHSIFL
ncbi:MAG: hypothetical protein R2730_03875 [Chitinophagales bacterium]